MKRLVVGISGASGIEVAVALLNTLKKQGQIETHLVISNSAIRTMCAETQVTYEELVGLVSQCYPISDVGAAIASGTFRSEGMIIVPCSMKTVAGIVSGYTDNLLLRAADVMLKERRRLVLMVRECPFSAIHLKNMHGLAMMGVDIMPLVMTFYNNPQQIDDMVHHMVCKALERFDIEVEGFTRWDGKSFRNNSF